MTIGDLLEWFAAGGFSYAIYMIAGRPYAVLTGAVCLVYFAQCYAKREFPKVRLPKVHPLRPLVAVVRRLGKIRVHIPRPDFGRIRARIIVSARLWWQMRVR